MTGNILPHGTAALCAPTQGEGFRHGDRETPESNPRIEP
jgi:hypothetical protein